MDEILTLAMAGTQRRPPPETGSLSGLSAEARLLGGAAFAGLAALAGRPLTEGSALVADHQPDDRPAAPQRHLQRILDGEYRALLPEWLELARERGLRPPAFVLPDLLEMGRQDRSLRPALAVVCGPRGAWLARHNPDWAYLLGESGDEQAWETGSAAVRVTWLVRLRQRDPAHARSLLQSTWGQEGADDRLKCLESFESGLSLEDEDFLEAALDDRSKFVRAQAAQLLTQIPGSRLSQRMGERVGRWVQEKQESAWMGLRKTLKLVVELPDQCGPDMVRDGLEPKSGRKGLGDRAWWLEQGLARAPLDRWRATPTELIEAARQSEWGEPIKQGWLQAAVAQRNLPWALALLQQGELDDGLFDVLSWEQQEEWLLRKGDQAPSAWLCRHQPYSPQLAQAVLQNLRGRTAQAFDWSWTQLLSELALRFPPEMGSQVESGWPESSKDWGRWHSYVEGLISTVKFRQSMNEEMRP